MKKKKQRPNLRITFAPPAHENADRETLIELVMLLIEWHEKDRKAELRRKLDELEKMERP